MKDCKQLFSPHFVMLGTLFLIPASSLGNEISSFCPMAASLKPSVRDCSTNYLAVEASGHCITGLLKRIDTEKNRLALAMNKESKIDRSGQHGQLENESTDISDMKATFAELILEADLVRSEQTRYLEIITFPGGVSRARARAMDMEDAYSGFLCFTSCEDAVKADIASVSKKISELKSSGLAAASIQDRSNHAMSDLSGRGYREKLSGAGRSSLVGRQIAGKSDITGILKKEKLESGLSGKDTLNFEARAGKSEDAFGSLRAPASLAIGTAGSQLIETSESQKRQQKEAALAESRFRGNNAISAAAALFQEIRAGRLASGERISADLTQSTGIAAEGDNLDKTTLPALEQNAGMLEEYSLFQRVHMAYERNPRGHDPDFAASQD